MHRAEKRISDLKAEVERLRNCEEIKLVEFLSRPDVRADDWGGGKIVVHHCSRYFEGWADDIISAARMAMHMERKAAAAARADSA